MTKHVELWGTFAVDDHLRRRAFAPEIIIFDRLVIPTPPAWTPDALREWPATWQPQRLNVLLEALGDYAIPMPWDQAKRERWSNAYSTFREERLKARQSDAVAVYWDVANIRQGSPQDMPLKYLTRAVLSSIVEEADSELVGKIRGLPLSREIESVVAYGSLRSFEEDAFPSSTGSADVKTGTDGNDALLLSWDFFVPEDPDLSDVEVLTRIINKLENDREFAEHRTAFNDLRRRLVKGGVEPLSARAEIQERLTAYNGILRSISRLQTARTVLTYAAIAAPLADFLVPGLGTAGGVALGLASGTWSKWAPNRQPGAEGLSVAMINDLRHEFAPHE
jgi:hypothetical protein